MKLTDADKDKIRGALEGSGCDTVIEPTDIAIYLAGKRAGREDMRERAARACRFATVAMSPETAKLLDQLADDIRALGVDDD